MERFECKVLVTHADVRVQRFDGAQWLGGWHDVEKILNRPVLGSRVPLSPAG